MSGAEHGARVAAAALAAVGARFRPHGRDRATGFDCVGLVAHSLAECGWQGDVPTGYALRGRSAADIAALLDARLPRGDGTQVGDILLVAAGPAQFHLVIRSGRGLVHADAGLRRVVERPGPDPWPAIGAWRHAEDRTEELTWRHSS